MTDARRHPVRGPSRLWPFKSRDGIVTIVDLGAQKIACAIVCLTAPRFGLNEGARNIAVLGSATVRSAGFSGGRIVHIAAAESGIRRAVAQAESQAGITANEVLVTGQFEGLASQVFEARTGSGLSVLLREDAAAISAAAEEQCRAAQRKLLHVFTSLQGESGHRSRGDPGSPPEGKAEVIAISMPRAGMYQIATCLSKSLLNLRGVIAGPVASAMAVTDSLERIEGVLAVDMGAQSTGYALFFEGIPVAVECLGSGGQTVTDQIARNFNLRRFDAERAKVRYGGVHDGLQADIDLPLANGETGEPISKFTLNQLIRSNASSIFRAINERLKGAGYPVPLRGAVLTGGGSLLPGISEVASQVLASEVRVAKPVALNGLGAGNALAALVGGCIYASRHQSPGEMPHAPGKASQESSYASRIGQWLKASF